MSGLKVCLLFGDETKHGDAIRTFGVEVVRPAAGEAASALKDADIVVGWPGEEQLKAAEKVKWIHLGSAGADVAVRSRLVRERGIVVTNSSGVFGIPIAEHVLGLMLALSRKLHEAIQSQVEGVWRRPEGAGELYGKTAGILGLGDIGTEVAKRAKAFGMHTIAVKRRVAAKPEWVDELYGEEGVDLLVQRSDFVILCLPGTNSTQKVLSRERIWAMKPDAFVINIGRGSLIDEEALIEALEVGRIKGAGLDVFGTEPLPAGSPLWKMKNVIISPHYSGANPYHADRSIAIFCRNLEQYLKGTPMENRVDFEHGY